MDKVALETLVAEEQLSRTGATLGRIMRQLATIPSTGNEANIATWKTFLEASRDQLVSRVQTEEAEPLATAAAALGSDGLTTLRHMGKDFAAAINAWPALCEAARAFE